jgi:hypothetical protein
MDNHPSRNWKWYSSFNVYMFLKILFSNKLEFILGDKSLLMVLKFRIELALGLTS